MSGLSFAQSSRTQYRRTSGYSTARSTTPTWNFNEQFQFLNRNNVSCKFVDDNNEPVSTVSSFHAAACGQKRICVSNVQCSTATYSFTFKGVACMASESGVCLPAKSCVLDSGYMDEFDMGSIGNPRRNEVSPSNQEIYPAR